MIRGLYTSALGLAVQYKRQEVASNNLANINTIGYKKESVLAKSFPEMLIHRLNDPAVPPGEAPFVGRIATGVQLDGIVTDYSKGIIRETGSPLDLALKSGGYFTINTPMGERYTRNGQFQIDDTGRIVTADGYPLMGQNGEIVVNGGLLSVSEEGTLYSNGKAIDSLRIVGFSETIIKEGSSLFQGDNPQEIATPMVIQGFVEDSNASPIEEMVNMINVMRAYESNQKVLQIQDSTLEKAANEVGRL